MTCVGSNWGFQLRAHALAFPESEARHRSGLDSSERFLGSGVGVDIWSSCGLNVHVLVHASMRMIIELGALAGHLLPHP